MPETISVKSAKRIEYLDILKFFAIFLVLWGHCIQHLLSIGTADPVHRFIYSFHMPLFAMVSGYFCSRAISSPFSDMLLRKARQLLLPCFTWWILTYVLPKLVLFFIWNRSADYSLAAFWDVLYQIFWFLKCVFVCYILAYLGSHFSWSVSLVISFLLSSSTFNISFLYPAFCMGCWLHGHHDILNRQLLRIMFISFAIFMVCYLVGGVEYILITMSLISLFVVISLQFGIFFKRIHT